MSRSRLAVLAAALLTSCAGPTLVMAQAPSPHPHAAITAEHRVRALDVLDRRLAHYVHAELTPAIRARLAERRSHYLTLTDPEAFRAAINADLYDISRDRHLQVWIEGRSRDDAMADGPPPTMEQMAAEEAGRGFGIRSARLLDDGTAYLDLAYFSGHPGAGPAIDAALEPLRGAPALIIDLRTNGGGGEAALLRLMGHLAPAPLPLETIFFRHCEPDPNDREGCLQDGRRDAQVRRADAVAHPAFPTQPIYVLTSKNTFSAAEALAYGLQAQGRATVIGEVTGGGANPSVAMDLGPWFTVVMPVAVTVHPATGGTWEGVGVTPDVAVPADSAPETARGLLTADRADAALTASGNRHGT
ncbi:MAG TPA: S41 family peptidase [Brevundimonas sp.]|jgi:hypothetical protein|uniref:S41 family peptidase n=1 Tax=Brevundimonas sp. TaxID=1871086 RepID=UPI002DE33CB6|nr:S41 family peptidase [Brevundimonas sp.]